MKDSSKQANIFLDKSEAAKTESSSMARLHNPPAEYQKVKLEVRSVGFLVQNFHRVERLIKKKKSTRS